MGLVMCLRSTRKQATKKLPSE